MNAKIPTLAPTLRSRIGVFLAPAIMAATLVALPSGAQAVVVQTTYRIVIGGSVDFGSGIHSLGVPVNNASITYDWSTATGQLRSTGRVRGTLYWDSFSAGCARLTIRFRNAANENLALRQIDRCGPGGDANSAANQVAVDEVFGDVNLDRIVVTVTNATNPTPVDLAAITIQQVTQKSFPVTINNGKADFGDGGHHFGRPDGPGYVTFLRNGNGTVTGGVDGILYWDAFDDDSCARMVIDHRTSAGTILRHRERLNCGPGGDANNQANQLFISEPLTSGSLFDIRLLVENTALPAQGVVRTYSFAGQVGEVEVEPSVAVAEVNEPVHYSFTWTVPEPLNWHDLETLEFRIMDGATAILHLRFEEAGNLISVFNEATGRFGKGSPVGSNKRLQTHEAMLDLGETAVGPVNSVLGVGPNSPTVRLDLAFRFKPSAAGKTYGIEVAARDDLGNEDPFTLVGALSVER
jgi:hypothetical protein